MLPQQRHSTSTDSIPVLAAGLVCYIPGTTSGDVQVLLLRKRAGFWDYPKGTAEAYDVSPIATAFREFEEETGLSCDTTYLRFMHTRTFESDYTMPSGRRKHVVMYIVQVDPSIREGKFTYDSKEIFSHRFVPLHKLQSYFYWEEDMALASAVCSYLRDYIDVRVRSRNKTASDALLPMAALSGE